MKFVFVITLLSAAAFANDANDQKTKEAQSPFHGVVPSSNGDSFNDPSHPRLLINPNPLQKEWHQNQIDKSGKSRNSKKSIIFTRPSNSYDNWQPNKKYSYDVELRTLTSMQTHEEGVHSNWAGVQFRARLNLRCLRSNRLRGEFKNFVYGHVHHKLPGGWKSNLPVQQYKPYTGMQKPFEVTMSGGLIKEVFVSKDTTMEEENLLKGILGSFQYDTSDRNILRKSKKSYLHEESGNGVFRKMEREVSGKCETMYAVNPLGLDILQNSPYLAPFVNVKKMSQENKKHVLDIKKTKNYGNCDRRVAYHFGVPEESYWENSAGNLMKRSTEARIIADFKNNTIYSSYTIDKIRASPLIGQQYSNEAEVVSSANVTLINVEHSMDAPKPLELRSAGNLIYRIVSKKQGNRHDDSSSSDSSSYEEDQNTKDFKQQGGDHFNQQSHSNSIGKNGGQAHNDQGSEHKPARRQRRSVLQRVNTDELLRSNLEENIKRTQEGNNRHAGSGSPNSRSNSRSDSGSNRSSSCDSDDDDDSGDSWLELPNMQSPSISLNKGSHDQRPRKSPAEIAKIAQDISMELQHPSNMPKENTLSKMNGLVNWLSTMNLQELEQTAKLIGPQENRADNVKLYAWRVYLDAVAQAGTNAAYTHIKNMIFKGAIKGEQAAQLVSVFPRTLRYPTKRLLLDFFNMAFDTRVKNQLHLNSSMLMASTLLINKGHVNNHTAHRNFPTHIFGRMLPKDDDIVTKNVMPVLERELRTAVDKRDSHRTQVLVRVIGNLGHPDMLRVFSPYIERRVKVTNYQRMFMVMCMDELAKLFPKQARYVLFNIYNNEGDNYEVRVAAIFELLKSRPTLNMLQQMAQATHTDSSIQVRAAIKSAIKYAAGLGTHEKKFERLSRYAKAAEHMLSEKEYGFQYSAKYLQYYFSKYLGAGLFQSLGLIGSEDSIVHKYFSYYSRVRFGGWLSPIRVQGGISSVSKFVELIKSQLHEYTNGGTKGGNTKDGNTKDGNTKDGNTKGGNTKDGNTKGGHGGTGGGSKLSAQDIANVFNIKGDLQEELQASLFLKLFTHDRIFAIGEKSFHNLPRYIHSIVEKLEKGFEYNYNKFYNQENVDISFPTITGMPFFFKSRSPVYIQLKGKVQAKISGNNNPQKLSRPDAVNVTGDLQFVLARDSEGRVGFYCPMGDKFMTSGVISKSQFYIPLKSKVNVDMINNDVSVEVAPLNPSEESKLYHNSIDSYTSVRERDSTVVPTQHKETKFNLPENPKYDFNRVYGKETFGMAFEVRQVYNSLPPQRSLKDRIMDRVLTMFKPQLKSAQKSKLITLKYQPQQSQNQQFVFSLGYNKQEQQTVKGAWSSSEKVISQYPSDVSCGSKARRQQLLESAVFGIPEGRGYVLDVGVQCLGKANAQFAASIANGDSKLDERSRMIFFYNHHTAIGKPFQAYSVISAKMPTVPTLDFTKALQFNSTLDFDMILKYGESLSNGAVVIMKGQMGQTPARKEYLKNAPMAKLCETEMASGNFLMPACQNVTIRANVMNSLFADVQYNNIGDGTRRLAYFTHDVIRHHLYHNIRDDWFEHTNPGNIKFQAEFSPSMNGLVSLLSSPIVQVRYANFRLSQWGKVIAGIVMNPTAPMYKQYADRVYGYQYQPTCAIDGKSINTFSNHTYNYRIGNCWHVAMQNGSQIVQVNGKSREVLSALQQSSVLVKENKGKKDFYVSYRSLSGDQITVEYYQGNNIVVNRKQMPLAEGKSTYVWTKDGKSKLMVAYMINNELTINLDDEKLTIITNGDRMLVSVGDSYRNTTSGICGDNSGNPKFDLLTPSNCLMRDNSLFGATWAMTDDDQCDPEVKKLQEEAEKEQTVCHEQITPSVQPPNMAHGESHTDSSHEHHDEHHTGESHNEHQKNEDKHKKIRQSTTFCQIRAAPQAYEENNEICITEQPIPACSNKCQEGGLYEMNVGVICQPRSDQDFQAMKKAIELGQDIHLDKTKYIATKEDYYMVPKTCN